MPWKRPEDPKSEQTACGTRQGSQRLVAPWLTSLHNLTKGSNRLGCCWRMWPAGDESVQSSWAVSFPRQKTGVGPPLQWPHLWTPQGPTGSWGSDSALTQGGSTVKGPWVAPRWGPPRNCSPDCFAQLHPPSTRKVPFSPHPAPLPLVPLGCPIPG